ncbi:MAG: DUF6924 domain-containing protein [Pirellulales bacterium]
MLRTDFSDDAAWDAVCAAIQQPNAAATVRIALSVASHRQESNVLVEDGLPRKSRFW